MKKLYDFEFEKTPNRIKDENTDFGKFDIMCWNFLKNECGTIYGSGINWENNTIDENKIGFLNTSPLRKGSRKPEQIKKDMLKALERRTSSWFTETDRVFKIIWKKN